MKNESYYEGKIDAYVDMTRLLTYILNRSNSNKTKDLITMIQMLLSKDMKIVESQMLNAPNEKQPTKKELLLDNSSFNGS